tara:strand:+ start:2376 stop:2612 length:237 start_codon:yes stop_codon:yes gene_type:complete
MAKGDYKDSTRKSSYRTLVKTNRDSKVSVASSDKRSRAELLDMVEELFETKAGGITAERLRAFLHMLVMSSKNSTDDR